MSNIHLSVVIPAHNEENRLPRTLEQVFDFLSRQPYTSEVILAENGSTDRTAEIAEQYALSHPTLHLLKLEGRGKGLAVREGMRAARGEFRFICDADLSMPIEELVKFMPPALEGFDIAIGSREAAGSRRFNEPSYRHWGGRLINLAIRLLILPGLQDTQCGFKCFRAAAADELVALQTLTGWSFDIELLYMARLRGMRIKEVPINWYFDPDSKIRAIPDALRMLGDILRIHLNARAGAYDRVPQS